MGPKDFEPSYSYGDDAISRSESFGYEPRTSDSASLEESIGMGHLTDGEEPIVIESFLQDNIPTYEYEKIEVENKPNKPLLDAGSVFKKLGLGAGLAIGGLGSIITAPAWLLTAGLGRLIGSQITKMSFVAIDKEGNIKTLDQRDEGTLLGSAIGSIGCTLLCISCFYALKPRKDSS